MPEPEPICAICGEPESAHHEFTTIQRPGIPLGCQCDPRDWRQTDAQGKLFVIPPPCPVFIPDDEHPSLCKRCQHMEECHGVPAGPALAKAA